jgi:hypothetical protein
MMFPDTTNDKQNAALRLAAERFRALANFETQSEPATQNSFPASHREVPPDANQGRIRHTSTA